MDNKGFAEFSPGTRNVTFKEGIRKADSKYYIHKHYPSINDVPDHRALDFDKQITRHVLMWRFHEGRSQWEAICERDNTIYTSPATKEDLDFRKGRSHT